jgi:hypothetical protein
LVNFLTLVTEFAAINLALSKMGVDPRYGVPLAAAGLDHAGADGQLPPVGAHRRISVPAGFRLVLPSHSGWGRPSGRS